MNVFRVFFIAVSLFSLFLSGCGERDGEKTEAKGGQTGSSAFPDAGEVMQPDLARFIPEDASFAMTLDNTAVLADPALVSLLKDPRLPFAPVLDLIRAHGLTPDAFQGRTLAFLSGRSSDRDYICCLFSLSKKNANELVEVFAKKHRLPVGEQAGRRTVSVKNGKDGVEHHFTLAAFTPELLQVLFCSGGELPLFERQETFSRLAGQLDERPVFSAAGDMDRLRDGTIRDLPAYDPAMRRVLASVVSENGMLHVSLQVGFASDSGDAAQGFASLVRSLVSSESRGDTASAKILSDFRSRVEGGAAFFSFRLNKTALTPRKQEKPDPCRRNLMALAAALKEYREKNDRFPEEPGLAGLTELRTEGLIDSSRVFACPFSRKSPPVAGEPLQAANCSYLYLAQGEKAEPSLPLLLELPGGRHRSPGFHVVNGDLSLRFVETKPSAETAEAYLTAALGHPAASEAEKTILKQARAWDER